ncbi:hypothetical protein AAF712_015613 [Marasmius tenuissimus]|uniref:G domain-containing protein n=1 Tax=Marasmius tenuissimus TaxID=585030 RepID=A0ABR2ZAC7_9AGAR
MSNGQDIPLPRGPKNPKLALIAVIGTVGSGKSTFINLATGGDRRVAKAMGPCTDKISPSQIFQVGLSKQDVRLIDTPGFDETNLKDLGTTLGDIDKFLNTSFQNQRLAGIIYLHRALYKDASSILPTELRQLRMLCGEETLKKVVIVTNGWEEVPREDWDTRRGALKVGSFRPALDDGARMKVLEHERDSVRAIVSLFIEPEVERLLDEDTDLKEFMVELQGDSDSLPPPLSVASTSPGEPTATHLPTEALLRPPRWNAAEEDVDIDEDKRQVYDFFGDKDKCGGVLKLRNGDAQEWLDLLQGVRL